MIMSSIISFRLPQTCRPTMISRRKSTSHVFEVIAACETERSGEGERTSVNWKGRLYDFSHDPKCNVFFTKLFSFSLGQVLSHSLISFRHSMK